MLIYKNNHTIQHTKSQRIKCRLYDKYTVASTSRIIERSILLFTTGYYVIKNWDDENN